MCLELNLLENDIKGFFSVPETMKLTIHYLWFAEVSAAGRVRQEFDVENLLDSHGGHLTVQSSDGMSCSLCCSILGIFGTVTLLAFATVDFTLNLHGFTFFLLVIMLLTSFSFTLCKREYF